MRINRFIKKTALIYAIAFLFFHLVIFWSTPFFPYVGNDLSHLLLYIEGESSMDGEDNTKKTSSKYINKLNPCLYSFIFNNIENTTITESFDSLTNIYFPQIAPRSPPII